MRITPPPASPRPDPLDVPVRIRRRLVFLSVGLLVLVSFGFTALNLSLSRGWVEEDLRYRAVTFAREVAATIRDRRELENVTLLQDQIREIQAVRQSALQLDILVFDGAEAKVVVSSHPDQRLPFTRQEAGRVRTGRVVSRLVQDGGRRHWEVLAPIVFGEETVGAVAAKFSLERADRLESRLRRWAFALTAASVALMGILMSVTIRLVVDRPIRRFLDAIRRRRDGDATATVTIESADEFGLLATHFNEMMTRVDRFNDELQTRVTEATAELGRRYQDVERLNKLLFENRRALSHAERLALAGQLMAEVAHEVGTPLHSVAGHLELLRKDLPPELAEGALARRLDIIETQVTRLTEIIAQLLDLTRRSPGRPGPVDLHEVVLDTADLVRLTAEGAGLTLDVDADPDLPRIRGYATQLQQLVLNLLTNAMDATPSGGRVEIRIQRPAEPDAIRLTVRDTGRGIPSPHQKQIFEPFFSTKEPGRGTGLGLFIAAQIVRDHRGRIEVESDEGRGSEFRVLLPLAAVPEADA